ncbi:MAG: hypothetical protein M0T79_01770 [Actinomycetota bacterium]|nr:hypothetical protein [Actinomycetota bacterium]
MARTLGDYLLGSARANSPSVARARSAFDQIYAIEREVAELREKHHVTQGELAAKAQPARIEPAPAAAIPRTPPFTTVRRRVN